MRSLKWKREGGIGVCFFYQSWIQPHGLRQKLKTNRQECTAYLLLAVSWTLGIMLCFGRLPIPNYIQGFKKPKMKPLHSFMFIFQMHKYENIQKDMSSKVNQLWRNHCPPLLFMIYTKTSRMVQSKLKALIICGMFNI